MPMDVDGLFAVFGPALTSAALVLARVTALIATTPLFSSTTVPTSVKAGMVGSITLLVVITLGPAPHVAELSSVGLAAAILKEMVVGGVMGLAVMVIFGALALAGQLVGIQMGFAIASVVDPATYQQIGVLAQVLNLLGLTLFLIFDGHLLLIGALFDSFQHVPLGLADAQVGSIVGELVSQGALLFEVGLRIALPVACVVLLVNVGLATIARTVPQVNIFIIGFLITISMGMLLMAYSMPSTAQVFQIVLRDAIDTAVRLSRMF